MDFNSWSTVLSMLTVESKQYNVNLGCLTHTLLVLMLVLSVIFTDTLLISA